MKTFLAITLAILSTLPVAAWAATRDQVFPFIAPTETVDGELLDQDGDGIPELLTGYRLYRENDEFIQEYEDNTITSVMARLNMAYNTAYCFYLTAYSPEGESVESNIVCRTITPARPKAPILLD